MSTDDQINWSQFHRVRELRLKLGLSQLELAERVGASSMMISHIETGDRRLRVDQLPVFAEALGVEPIQLVRDPDGLADQVAAILAMMRGMTPKEREQLLRLAQVLGPHPDKNLTEDS